VTVAGARVDAVLFDAGGVLVVPDPVAIGAVVQPFGGTTAIAALIRAHYGAMRAQDTQGAVHDDWDVYRRTYLGHAGVRGAAVAPALAALDAIWSPHLWRFPLAESVAALRRLHDRGVPIGVVSNASGQIEGTLATQGVCQVGRGAGVPVTVVVDSHVVGVAKPDPLIFATALAELARPPERVAYVGDSVRNDVAAATAAGLVPLLLDPHDDHRDAPYERIRSLHDLLAMV
jgi:putative hydrolase of the HAD superfamily